ncbi:MAG TPA: hypothetical protein VKZ60_08340 [Chloroflexota bacterium]|nr:hypothetical protein [Chloroflexota bacterium]
MLSRTRLAGFSRRSLYALPLVGLNSLFTDGAAISLSVRVGPPWSLLFHWLVLAPWACLVLWALYYRVLPPAVVDWLGAREARLGPRLQRLLRWGKPTAVLLLAATFGPLSALIGIRLFRVPLPRGYLLAVQAAAAYCIVWTGLVYGGGWLLVQHLWAHWHP